MSWVGPAIAVVSTASEAISSATGTCRHRPGPCFGATDSSSSMFANRSTRFLRARWITTYSATSPATMSRYRKNHALANPDSGNGPISGRFMSARLTGTHAQPSVDRMPQQRVKRFYNCLQAMSRRYAVCTALLIRSSVLVMSRMFRRRRRVSAEHPVIGAHPR